MKCRIAAGLIIAGFAASSASAQYTECRAKPFGLGYECTTTAPQPPQPRQKSWLENLNEQMAEINRQREAREAREEQKRLYELQRQQALAEQQRLAQEQARLRQQADQMLQSELQAAARRDALEQLNMQVSQAVLEHRCEDAKFIALSAGNLDLADRAMRLCTPPPKVQPQGKKPAAAKNAPAAQKPQADDPYARDARPIAKPAQSPPIIAMPTSVHLPNGSPIGGSLVKMRRLPAGVAIKALRRSPVLASADGTVEFAGSHPSLKTAVRISHGGEIESVYGNLQNVSVYFGQKVYKGQKLGEVAGPLSEAYGDLIYQVTVGSAQVDPVPYIPGAAVIGASPRQN